MGSAVEHLSVVPEGVRDDAVAYDQIAAPHPSGMTRREYNLIDLFSGAGGLTLGFSQAFGHPFRSVWANDFNEDSVRTYNANFGDPSLFSHGCTLGDIVSILEDPAFVVPSADIVIGGPPCQGFSLLNKGRAQDPRKQLWRPYLSVVERSGADVFVMENVPQLLGAPEFEEILDEARRMGFRLTWAKLCAADYGVAQVRWRAFVIGCRFADPSLVFPPVRTHFAPNDPTRCSVGGDPGGVLRWRTVRDAIGDLPPPEGTEIREASAPLDLHFGRTPTPMSMARYRAIPGEGMNRFDLLRIAPELTPDCWVRKKEGGTDLFGRLWWGRPAFTIRTEFFKPEKGRYLHPEQHRPITHREAARIQSFPDGFHFVGSKTEIARQIGNAVPPLLAARVADCARALLAVRDGVRAR